MKIADYTYHRPQSLAAACDLGRAFGKEGRYLAGGTELLVDLKNGRDRADHVISLQDIPELRNIEEQAGRLRIGAMVTLTDVAESPLVCSRLPVLRDAVLRMGGTQIRNQGTIGGNFCRAVPCADTPPVCIIADAQLRLVGAESERTLPAEEFFLGPRQTVLCSDEILTEIQIPSQPDNSGASYQRFSLRRGSALAVAAVAARLIIAGGIIEDARVVLNAVAPVPLAATKCINKLVGQAPGEELFAEAARTAAAEAQPITDLRGSAEFRRHLVAVLTVRALREAVERAQKGRP